MKPRKERRTDWPVHAVRLPPDLESWGQERLKERDYHIWTDLLLMAVLHLRECQPVGRVALKEPPRHGRGRRSP